MLVEPHRHVTLAMMVCEGWSRADIAEAMCLSEETVEKYTGSEAPRMFKDVLAGYRAKLERLSVERRFRMAELSEQCYSNVKEALLCNDIKLKTETSFRILDEVSPKPVVETAPGVSVNVNLTRNSQVNAQIVALTGDLLDEFQSLKSIPGEGYQRHLKLGSEALPSSYQEVQNEKGEPIPVLVEEVANVPEGEPRTEETE